VQRLSILALVALTLTAAGCGGSSGGSKKVAPASGGSGQTVQVKETEFKLTPSSFKIGKPGTVTFMATNAGKLTHALEIEGNGVEQKIGSISPGSSGKLTVNLSKNGTYQLYCPIDGHRAMGMQATVVVGSASAGGGGTTTTPTTSTKTSSGYGY
jgi:uncharacterized cupredoxin-like copper-binding protein